jgi:4-amino-4-deoxy-L-arabinose transferase-like glycosyltransferase
MGHQIAKGDWTPMFDESQYMRVGPMLPLLIAFFIKIFGNPNLPVFIYNIIITSLVVPVLYYLGKEIFNRKIGWFIAIWGLLYMDFFKYNPRLLKEPTVFFFLPLTLFLLIRAYQSNKNFKYLLLSALSFAWLIHADERYFIYFPVFSLIFCLKNPFNLKQIFRSIAVWVILVFLLMLPWNIHNYKVFGQVVIISPRATAFTSRFWGKNLSGVDFNYKEQTNSYINELNTFKTEKNEEKYGITPHEYKGFELYVKSFINFWQPAFFKATYIQHGARLVKWSWRHNLLSLVFYGFFLPLYVIGLVLLVINFNPLGLFFGMIPIIHSLFHTYMIWTMERYRSPVVFIVVMIGIYATFVLVSKVSGRIKTDNLKGDN